MEIVTWKSRKLRALQSFVSLKAIVCVINCSLPIMSMQRASKRARMNLNHMMAGMNPVLAGMFGMNGMNPAMMGMNAMPMGMNPLLANAVEEDDSGEDGDAQSQVVAAASNAAPAPKSPGVVAAVAAAAAVKAAPVAQTVGDAAEGPDTDFHSGKLPDMMISRSVTYLKNLPRARLSEGLELIHASLDTTFLAECSQGGLLCLLWLFTRLKPGLRVSDLRTLDAFNIVLKKSFQSIIMVHTLEVTHIHT